MTSAAAILVPMSEKRTNGKTADRRLVLVSVPAEIKRKAVDRVEEGSSANLNDELIGVLAARYGVKFEPTGRPGGVVNADSDGKLLLRMPPALKKKIARDALGQESNLRDVICAALADEYDVEFEARGTRTVPFGGGAG